MKGDIKKILIVDDEEKKRKALAEFFTVKGYIVIAAGSGVEALSAVIDQRIDVIIMKAVLPRLTGIETAPILKKINPEVRIILTLEGDHGCESGETEQIESFPCFLEPLCLEEIERNIILA